MIGCDDLLIGGTVTAGGVTGGYSINGTAYSVADWSSIFGGSGLSGRQLEVLGRPGGYMTGDLLGRSRFFNLELVILDRNTTGGIDEPTAREQKELNTDILLQTIASPVAQVLEVVMADGSSRYIEATALSASPINQPRRQRRITIPYETTWPYWRDAGAESTDTLSGSDTLAVTGRQPIYDAVLTFAGDGSITHPALGWSITIAGSGGAVVVDLGNRTVTEGGNEATNRMRRTGNREWGWFTVGNNSVTVAGTSVGVAYRAQY
jgi:hypothetical protein